MKQLILNTFFQSDDERFPFSSLSDFTTEQFFLLLALVLIALGFFGLIVR